MFDKERLLFDPVTPAHNAIPLVFAFPNTYTVGITSLGYQLVWAKFSQREDVDVRRLFTDLNEKLPSSPEIVGFSFSWELDYTNLFDLLERLDIPLRAAARKSHHPIIFGGGSVLSANPEPFADFFDVILLGDGENLLDEFIDAYQDIRGGDRQAKLLRLAQVEGIYVPS